MRKETFLDRIQKDSNLWLNAVQAEDEGDYLKAFSFYLKDATEYLRQNSLVRAALSCSCAAECLRLMGHLAPARQLNLQAAALYEKNAGQVIAYSVREALWSYQEAYEFYNLAGESNKAREVFERYVSLSRKVNPLSGEKEALESLRQRKIEAESGPNTHQTNMEISIEIDNAIKDFLKETRLESNKDDSVQPAEQLHRSNQNLLITLGLRPVQLEQVTDNKKVKWALDLIRKLNEAQVGEFEKLNRMRLLLEGGDTLDEDDIKYLKERERHLMIILESRTKVTFALDAIKKLQENESNHSKKLMEIRRAVEQGIVVLPRELRYLNRRYEKTQRVLDQQKRVEWDLERVEKLLQSGVGDPEKLVAIKELLEDGSPVPENDIIYLSKKQELLRHITCHTRKIEYTLHMIEELEQRGIGDPKRLGSIKKRIEESGHLTWRDINYLKKGNIMLTKRSKKDVNNGMQSDFGSLLKELNSVIDEPKKERIDRSIFLRIFYKISRKRIDSEKSIDD